jgi:ankyrin repeat protein
LFEIY